MNKNSKPVVIEMTKKSDHKGSVRFDTADSKAAVTNVYVARTMPGIDAAQKVKVTIEVVE